MNIYNRTVSDIVSFFSVDPNKGLSQQEASKRLARDGYNALPETKAPSLFVVFLDQFKSPLVYLLLFAATIIFFVGDTALDAFIISGVLLFNAVLGTVQERRTSAIIESLKRLITTDSIVVREGKRTLVPDTQLVVGDIIILQEGQRVPADARIIESHYLHVDEAILTGESFPVLKNTQELSGTVAVADQHNMVFKGTIIVSGSGRAVVVKIGAQTEIGRIHHATVDIKTDIPLRREVEHVSYVILIFILAVCSVLFIMGLLSGKPIKELLVMLTALFICVVPEGLPVVLTMVLTAGAYRMARRNVLVKNLQAVESLGRANVIITDKTGTLTRNEMMVTVVKSEASCWQVTGVGYHQSGAVVQQHLGQELDQIVLQEIAYATALLNNSDIAYDKIGDFFTIKGDPTEAALFVFSQKAGVLLENIENKYTCLYELAFDSKRRYHAVFFANPDDVQTVVMYCIGSPETIFAHASVVSDQTKQNLDDLLNKGLRVVAIAKKIFPRSLLPSQGLLQEQQIAQLTDLASKDLQVLGLCGIEDALRPEVFEAIDQARSAGLLVVMATGDHQKTALEIAKKSGIYKDGDTIITGTQLDESSDEQLLALLDHATVFARVSPEHKIRIVNLFHKRGYIVAMTGDGVNDAPSLVAADLGIAMGRIGTEVAKQASDLVLLDDSFASIVSAIAQGRHTFYTLKRVLLYFFATNLGEILIVLFALILGMVTNQDLPLPLTAAQILWLNLVTDGFMDVSLSMEPQEKGLLDPSWLSVRQRLIDTPLLVKTVIMAVPMAVGTLIMFWYQWQADLPKARTFALVLMAMFQWFNAWNCRSNTKSILQIGIFRNGWFVLAAVFVFCLQLLVVYMPWMQYIFKTTPLLLSDWLVILSIASTIVIADEIRKLLVRWYYHTNGV